MPLPPYIKETLKDKDKYQTVYAKYDGSAAAPTAGLHFTEELLEEIKEKGVNIANVTLHDKINTAKKSGNKIIAVGTTSCRVLESIADENGSLSPTEGDTNIFIYPGYKFKCLDYLITNFHLPESTLIMLVSSLAGREFILKAYNEAVAKKYKFFSFGDAMLIK